MIFPRFFVALAGPCLMMVCPLLAQEPAAVRTPAIERFADPLPSPPRVPFAAGEFSLRPGEVVVFTGSTNGVFEQQQGWLEAYLATHYRDARPIFRNMCWEGDTVFEQGRAMNFGGWGEQFEAVGASTIICWFGQVEALDDSHTVEDFTAAYGKLLDEFGKWTARLVVIAPPRFEKPTRPLVRDNTSRNERIAQFTDAARKLAGDRKLIFVEWQPAQGQFTENGMHFTVAGQRQVSELIAAKLGVPPEGRKPDDSLRQLILAKNRFWFDCWRTMNWCFPYGDRTWADFPKPGGDRPLLSEELQQYKPLIRASDARIHAATFGEALPPLPPINPEPPQPVVSPEEELKSLQVADGLQANLFASEADGLVKPIQICWDPQGRLWALCVPSYPQFVPGVIANDYILICEDTDHDGKADRFERYADGLQMPTGFALGDGGVYLCENTQLVHLRKTAEGKIERKVLLSGFGTGDSHQNINTPVWGPDGRLWFTQGLHNYSLIETPRGLSRCIRTGVWRYNPRTEELDHFVGNAAASENAWGVGFDRWGQTFYTPGNEPGMYYLDPALVPLPVEQIAVGQYRDIGKIAATGPKGMRTDFLESRHLPPHLRGLYVKSTYIAGFVEMSRLSDAQSGFSAELVGNLISSKDPYFRPLETKIGPDGAIYVCDWCNPIIGHYQASYRDPRRDHVHGRVWRLTAKDRELLEPPQLDENKTRTVDWLNQLGSEDRWVREQTQAHLASIPASVVLPAFDRWLATLDPSASATPGLLMEALTVCARQDAVNAELLNRALGSSDPQLRAFATHMIGLWANQLPDGLKLVERMASDEVPRVRLEAIVSASYLPTADAVQIAARALELPRDKWIDYAFIQAVRKLKPLWLPALASGSLSFEGRPEQLQQILLADGTPDAAGFLKTLIGESTEDIVSKVPLLILLIEVGAKGDLNFVFERASHLPPVLDALSLAARRKKLPAIECKHFLRPFIEVNDLELQRAAIRLAGAWNAKEFAELIQQQLQSSSNEAVRIASVGALAQLLDKAAMPTIEPLASAEDTNPLTLAAIEAIARIDVDRAATFGAGHVHRAKDEPEVRTIVAILRERKGGDEALAKALARSELSEDTAKLLYRACGAAGVVDGAVVALANQRLGVSAQAEAYDAGTVKQLAADAIEHGDSARGRELFLSKLANCTACHKLAGQGGDIGPDLSNIGKQVPADVLVESVLWPNRQVKEGYLAVKIATDEGEQFVGYKLRESEDEIVIRDTTTNVRRTLAKANIEAIGNAGSVMPAGLTATMTSAERRDLLRFLIDQGK